MQAARLPDGLRVDQVEGEVELPPPVELAVGGGEVGPVRVRRRDREVAGRGRPVALAAGAVGRAAAAWVMPCQDRANDTISCLPVTSLAIRIAASFDSAPVVSSSTFSSGSGSDSASRRARSTTGRDSMPLNRWSRVPTCRRTVATIVRMRSGRGWRSSGRR